MAASPTRHQLLASRLFRWARTRSSGDPLKSSSVVTADFNAGGERPALDTHDVGIGRLIGVEGELRSIEQAGSSIQLASSIERVLDKLEAAVLPFVGSPEWRHNRWAVGELVQRFLSAAGSRPAFVFGHRSAWSNDAVVRGCFGGFVHRIEEEVAELYGTMDTTVFRRRGPLVIQPSAFAWHGASSSSKGQEHYFCHSEQEEIRGSDGVRSAAMRTTLGLGHHSEIVRLKGSGIFAPHALAGVKALWAGEANEYEVTAYGVSRPNRTFIGHLSPANALRFLRLSKVSSMVIQDELIVQLHPGSGEVLYIKAHSSPLTRLYGVGFSDTSMGTFTESL